MYSMKINHDYKEEENQASVEQSTTIDGTKI
jgi:hypothetical protein